MASDFDALKKQFRARWKAEIPKLAGSREPASERLCSHIRKTEFFPKAKRIGLYVARQSELKVLELWDPTRCCFPKVLPDGRLEFYRVNDLTELTPGYHGILEPPAVMKMWVTDWRPGDFVLTPGAAFDKRGGRVGTGAGFYDRFLSTTSARPWGVGWEGQISREPVPVGPNDIRMWALCTEDGWRWAETPEAG